MGFIWRLQMRGGGGSSVSSSMTPSKRANFLQDKAHHSFQHVNTYILAFCLFIFLFLCTLFTTWILLIFYLTSMCFDAPPNSLKNSNVNPKVKITEGVRVRSLTHNILGVKGHIGAPRWGLRWVTSTSTINMNLHKPNNKLVSV